MNIPNRKFIGTEEYVLVILRVQSTYENGTPEDLTLITDDLVCELSEDSSKNKFITAYVPKNQIKS
jgi:hypothetical protein